MSLLLALTESSVDYTLACDAGAYSITGNDATLTYAQGATAYVLTCDAGAYVITGQQATLTKVSGQAETYSGGYDLPTGRRKTKKEVYAERVRLGIIKEDIERKAVEVVAKAEAKAQPQYRYEPQDPQKLVRELMAQLRLKVPSPDYTRAIELAIRAAEQDEEESLILLLA